MSGIAYIRIIIFALLSVAVLCAQKPDVQSPSANPSKTAPADPNKFCLVINGAGGDPVYASQFETWTNELSALLSSRFGFATKHLKVLSEKSAAGMTPTAENVKHAFAALKSELQPENALFVFFIGHGSYDGKESKFNLVGPDLSATEYATLLTALPTKRVVVFNMSSASGEFARSLSAKGRIVITATKSGQETNATRFAGFFIEALKATDSDTDQDGHISVLEAFVYANRLTSEFYTRAGRLATEHALLEDNGDGVGREKAENGEGLLARATYLDSLSYEQAAANAVTAKLLRERARLEGEIEQLIGQKANLPEAVYETSLEKLFIELAKINRSIKQAGS
ncbi:MAG TPA: hypothetical protein VLB68_21825 [Pyrinomonadaceae bacterium]|nr:hypothetical protein [Pyrinomonadaceae bacterium]